MLQEACHWKFEVSVESSLATLTCSSWSFNSSSVWSHVCTFFFDRLLIPSFSSCMRTAVSLAPMPSHVWAVWLARAFQLVCLLFRLVCSLAMSQMTGQCTLYGWCCGGFGRAVPNKKNLIVLPSGIFMQKSSFIWHGNCSFYTFRYTAVCQSMTKCALTMMARVHHSWL